MTRPFSISDAVDDVLALLDGLGGGPVALLGQSMGGNIGQEIVFRAPARVSALVAVDCACNTLPLSLYQRVLVAVSPGLLRLMPERLLRSSIVVLSKQPEVRRYLAASTRDLSRAEIIDITVATVAGATPGVGLSRALSTPDCARRARQCWGYPAASAAVGQA
jgi:3-oxoadipate enol-lactonase